MESLASQDLKGDEKPERCKFGDECGYWWGYKDPLPEDNDPESVEQQAASQQQEKSKEEKCSSKETWSSDCGFIDPKEDYEFMVVQRDELSKKALMNSADQSAVHAFQKYMAWAVDASVTYSRTWEYNMMQDQDINPFAKHPISRFGLKATFSSLQGHKKDIFEEIRDQGGVLVFWSRSDCDWCHKLVTTYKAISADTGIPLHNVSIGGDCLPGFEGEFCEPESEETITAAKALRVQVVPDLFVLLDSKNPEVESWVRVSTGFEDISSIKTRISTYFQGVRAASKAGLAANSNHFKDQNRPPVTFDSDVYSNKPDSFKETGL